MTQITLSVDDKTLERAQKIASDRNTTLTEMVRQFVESIAAQADAANGQTADLLRKSFECLSRDMGQRQWRREDLHER